MKRPAVGVACAFTLASFALPAGAEEDRSQVLFDRAKQMAGASGAGAGSGGRRTFGYAAGGVGVLGVASGALFGGLSVSKHTECAGPCAGAERDRQSQAYVFGNVSTIAFAVGVAALVGAAIILFAGAAPDRRAARLEVR